MRPGISCRWSSSNGTVNADPFTLVTCWYTWLNDGSTPTTFFPFDAKADPTTSRISPEPAAIMTLSGRTPWCFAISSTIPPSGYPYRLAYLKAPVIAFMTDSGGPYGFSLNDSLANESYSSPAGSRG